MLIVIQRTDLPPWLREEEALVEELKALLKTFEGDWTVKPQQQPTNRSASQVRAGWRSACRQVRLRRQEHWSEDRGGKRMPMFSLTTAQREKITVAAARLEEPAAALLAALAAYNKVLGELRELVRGVETDWQAAWDKRSERWQESVAGQSTAEAIAE
jgi:hypothetical protein